MAYWCDKETFKLIELWGEDKIQAQLEECKRNKEVFDAISRKMEEAGYQKSATQCRDKTKKLKKAYRAIKDKHGKTGEGRKKWLFLEVMDSVLGDKPATRPAVLIDTMGERVEEDANHEAVETANVEVREEEGDSDFESERYPNSSPSSASTSGHEEPSVKVSTGKDDQKASTLRLSNAEKQQLKKRNKEERFEKAMTQVVDLVMKAQESSDSKFIELEERECNWKRS